MEKTRVYLKLSVVVVAIFLLLCTNKNSLFSYAAEEQEQSETATLTLKKNSEESQITVKISGMKTLRENEAIKIYVWNKEQGQSQGKWYRTNKKSDGYTRTFKISDFKNVVGKYYVYAYLTEDGDQQQLLTKKSVVVKGMEGGKLSFRNIDHENGTCKVKISGITSPAKIKKVKVLVWSNKNQKDDAQWYTAKKKDNSWYIEFSTENHEYISGKYIFQAKVWDTRGVSAILKEKSKVIRVNTKINTKIKANSTQSKYTVTISHVRFAEPVDKVMIAVWGKENGDGDMRWYTAKDKGNGTYIATIDISKHKEAGTYYVSTYVKMEEQEKELKQKKTFTVTDITAKKVSFAYQNDEKGSVQVNIAGVNSPAGIEKVEVAAYTNKKGKDDLVTGEAINGGTVYKDTISVVDHQFETGKYVVDITITDARGIVKTLKTKTIQLKCSEVYKTKTTFDGIDVSRYQGGINWNQVKAAGIDFVMIQVGYRDGKTGMIVEDRYFETNINGALAAGIDVGIYFFSQAITEAEAKEEAAWAIKKAGPYKLTYPIAIDSEYRKGGRANSLNAVVRTGVVNAFCQEVKQSGYTPAIYASKSWFEDNLIMGYLSSYDVWLARYNVVPEYTGPFQIWQYSNKGYVSGINGYVDRNVGYKRYY